MSAQDTSPTTAGSVIPLVAHNKPNKYTFISALFLTIMHFNNLASFAVIMIFSSALAQAAPAFDLSNMEARSSTNRMKARWGSGKFKVDDNTYHRSLKPAIMQKFKAHDSKFASKCGTNPDFMVDKNGDVWPEPQKKNAKPCPKNKFTLDLASLIESYQPQPSSASAQPPHSISSAFTHGSHKRNLNNSMLEARWGSGKFNVDDDTYHRSLKPAIIQQFKAHDSKFASKCGTNPDFMVDRSGNVWPEPQKKNAKACPKNKFTLDLASLIESYQPKRSPSPA